MNKKWFLLIFLLCLPLVSAVCPLCTVAIGAGAGVLRYFGIDDIITGSWIGALTLSSALWFDSWLNKKHINFMMRRPLVIIAFYIMFLLPLYFIDLIGLQGNTIFGIDKIVFGSIIGTIIFILSVLSDNYLRKINGNKAVFPYQKVVIPVVFLILSSVFIYLLLKIV